MIVNLLFFSFFLIVSQLISRTRQRQRRALRPVRVNHLEPRRPRRGLEAPHAASPMFEEYR